MAATRAIAQGAVDALVIWLFDLDGRLLFTARGSSLRTLADFALLLWPLHASIADYHSLAGLLPSMFGHK